MTIKNLKQIAIKYATTKGSRVPLAPDELCNAVVQYFNEFLKITVDINTIQVAVTEEGGNIVFTITGNTYDGKPITPIVITVDHNDFVTDQEFEEFKTTTNAAIQKNTESINSLSFRVEDTENDITTIQVQVGQINTRVGNTETDVTNLKNRVDNTETNIAKINSTLNNKLDKITSPSSNFVLYANIEGNDTQIRYASGPATNSILYRDETGKTAVVKGVSGQDVANMENIADVEAKIPDVSGFATNEELQNVQNSLNNKRSVISSPASSYVVYTQANGLESNLPYSELANQTSTNIMARRANGTSDVKKGISGENVANMENIADVEAKIPDVSGFATNEELQNVQNSLNNKRSVISSPASSYVVYTQANGLESNLPYSELANQTSTNIMARRANGTSDVKKGISGENVANMENIADVEAKIPSITNLADVTKENTFTDVNHFTQYITSFGVEIGTGNADDDEYDVSIQESNIEIFHYISGSKANSLRITENKIMTLVYPSNEYNIFDFPNKSGTLALTSDIIKNPIYFISFYINAPDENLHLTGTMMSKNSYGTGQKTNEEFAVLLADNLYINSNEGLAVSGKLVGSTEEDIICIYSDDGLTVRYLDEKNSDFELPTAVFFVMETEL